MKRLVRAKATTGWIVGHVVALGIRNGFVIAAVLLTAYTLNLLNPTWPILAWLPPLPSITLPQFGPVMVQVPVPTHAIAAGEVIRDDDLTWRSFVRPELTGKAAQAEEVRFTIAKHVLVSDQPIALDDIEPYVMVPVARTPLVRGEVISSTDYTLSVRAFGRQAIEEGHFVLALADLENKLVVSPIAAERPINWSDVDDYVRLPVVRMAVPGGAAFTRDNVALKTIALGTIQPDLSDLVLSDRELLDAPDKVKDHQNIAPDTPIKRSTLVAPTPHPG